MSDFCGYPSRKEYDAARYQRHRRRRVGLNARWRRRQREMLETYKVSHGCFVCGYNTSPMALHFHHVDPGTKVDNISNMLRTCSFSAALSEIEKCVLLCGNCHAEVHDGLVII